MEEGADWSKKTWKTLVDNAICIYHENKIKELAKSNSKMKYLNITLNGLTGRAHPALLNIFTVQDTKKLIIHLKFLTGNFVFLLL